MLSVPRARFCRRAVRVFSLQFLVVATCLGALAQSPGTPPTTAVPVPTPSLSDGNQPLQSLSLSSGTFDSSACNRIPDARIGVQGPIPSDADLQIDPGSQAHAPQSVDEVRCAVRLAVFFSHRADVLMGANTTLSDSQTKAAANDYRRSDEILWTLAKYFESHADQPSPINDDILAEVKSLVGLPNSTRISAVCRVLLVDPLSPKDPGIGAMTIVDYYDTLERITEFGGDMLSEETFKTHSRLNYSFPARETEGLRNFAASAYIRSLDPQTPDAFFSPLISAMGTMPPTWNAQVRSLAMLANVQRYPDSVEEIVVTNWVANHKLGTVSQVPLVGSFTWSNPAHYAVTRTRTWGVHGGDKCGASIDNISDFTNLSEQFLGSGNCSLNKGTESDATYAIFSAGTNSDPTGVGLPGSAYYVSVGSFLRGGYDPGSGLVPSRNNLTANLEYNLTANAVVPQCNDITKCSGIVDLLFLEDRYADGSTTDPMLASLASSATYQGPGMAQAAALYKGQHTLVDRSSGPVLVWFNLGRKDHHDQACCFHHLLQTIKVIAAAPDPYYPPVFYAVASNPAPQSTPLAPPPLPTPAVPANPATFPYSQFFRQATAQALQLYIENPNARIDPVSSGRFTIGQIPADRRSIVGLPKFDTRFEDTYLHFIELSILDALPPNTLDGYDKKSIDLARHALFQEARRVYLDDCRRQLDSDNQYLAQINIPTLVQTIDGAVDHIISTSGSDTQTPLDFLDSIGSFANNPNATNVETSLTVAQQAAHTHDRQAILNSLAKLRDDLWHLNATLKKRHDAMLLELSNLDPPPGGN